MAGITAIASSKTHAASGVDVTASGFIAGEGITLTASPTGTDYLWSIALPSGSSAARVGFAGETEASASFTPDVTGLYSASVTVDGTVYVLRMSVTAIAASSLVQLLRLSPIADEEAPTPTVGGGLYWSSTQGALALKDSAGDVFTVDVTAV